MKHLLIYLAISSALFSPSVAQSSALTRPFNGYINKAVSNSIVKKLQTMGFAANDPIYGITLAAAETTLAAVTIGGSVAATVAAVGTAPVWLSVALGLGAAYEIYDFTMGDQRWHADPALQKISYIPANYTQSPPPPAPFPAGDWQSPPPVMPVDFSDPGVGNNIAYAPDLPMCGVSLPSIGVNPSGSPVVKSSYTVCGRSVAEIQDMSFKFYVNMVARKLNYTSGPNTYYVSSNAPLVASVSVGVPTACTINELTCPQGVFYHYRQGYSGTYYTAPVGTTTAFSGSDDVRIFKNPYYLDTTKAATLHDASSRLQPSDLTQRADPALLAAIANKIWQQAAQQVGYAGAPYDVANPVTAADVLADIAAGTYPHPTVADLLSLVSPNAQTAPRLDPATQPIEATDTVAKVDLGPDPGIAQPTLETAPTGNAVVAQVMGLLPSLSGFTMPAHTSTCTAPTFTFFNSTQSMQPMCDLLEQQRLLLSTIFSAMWGVVSLAMVLKA